VAKSRLAQEVLALCQREESKFSLVHLVVRLEAWWNYLPELLARNKEVLWQWQLDPRLGRPEDMFPLMVELGRLAEATSRLKVDRPQVEAEELLASHLAPQLLRNQDR
jgi:hypothetical protein